MFKLETKNYTVNIEIFTQYIFLHIARRRENLMCVKIIITRPYRFRLDRPLIKEKIRIYAFIFI